MLTEANVDNFKVALKRIFAMPMTRSTFRELQQAAHQIMGGNRDGLEKVMESFQTGESKIGSKKNETAEAFNMLVAEYSTLFSLAREIQERGEFISMVTSDYLGRDDQVLFFNQMRRIDGKDFHFFLDVPSMYNIVQHFIGRLQELKGHEEGKKVMKDFKDTTKKIQAQINELAR